MLLSKEVIFIFKDLIKKYNLYYTVKANSNIENIKILEKKYNNNLNYAISCIEHFKILEKLNINPQKICLINIFLPLSSYEYLYLKGVRFFVFDDYLLMKNFLKNKNDSSLKISIRVSLTSIFNDENIRDLGTTIKDSSKMIKYLKENNIQYGISIYFPDYYKNRQCEICKCLKDEYNFISLGGIRDFKILENIEKRVDSINLEVGELLVNTLCNKKTKIIRIKDFNNKKLVVIDESIYFGLLDKYIKYKIFDIYLSAKYKLYTKKIKDGLKIYLYGNSGNVDDYIGEFYIEKSAKQDLCVGNCILIKNTGAYCDELITKYGQDLRKDKDYEI